MKDIIEVLWNYIKKLSGRVDDVQEALDGTCEAIDDYFDKSDSHTKEDDEDVTNR
jgi:hypothetical protein